MTNDPIVEKERIERLRKIRDLAQRVHANKDRIRRNTETIQRANEDNQTANIELQADTHALIGAAVNAGLGSRKDSTTVDVLVGLLVELPMWGAVVAPRMPDGLDSAHGSFLDAYGTGAKIKRNPGEADNTYRDRLRFATMPGWVNP